MDYKKYTIKSYNSNAKKFSDKFKGLMDINERAEFKIFTKLLKGNNILDLGCGSGDASEYFKNQGLNVTAIDISSEMIKITKEKNINALVMDMENLDFENESFDGIWSMTSILHLPKKNVPKVIENISKILKSKGVFCLGLKEGNFEGFIEDEYCSNTKRFFSYWKKEEILKILEKEFILIKSNTIKTKNRIFLVFFLRKK